MSETFAPTSERAPTDLGLESQAHVGINSMPEQPLPGWFSSLHDRFTHVGQRLYAETSATATHLKWAVTETLDEYNIHTARELGQYAIHSARETLAQARDNFADMRAQGLRGSLRSRAVRFGVAAGVAATSALGGFAARPQEKQVQAQTGGLVGALEDAMNAGFDRGPIEAPLDETTPVDPDPTKGGTVLFMPMTMAKADATLGHFPEPKPIEPLPPTAPPPPDPKADVAFSYGDGGGGSARANARIAGFRGDKLTLELGDQVGNYGPDVAKRVYVDIELSEGLNYDPTNVASTGCNLLTDEPITPDMTEKVRCVVDDGELDPNEFQTFDLGVVIDRKLQTVPASLRVDAQVSAASPVDPDTFNNDASTTVDVQGKTLLVNGKGFNNAPDSRSLYARTEGEFPYAGSLVDENGKPIDAYIYRDEDGKEICRFTPDGAMYLGEREFELTEGCTANIEISDTFPIPDNDTNDGQPYHTIRNYGRNLLYPPAKFDELLTPSGAMTVTARAGMFMQNQAGLYIGRGISYERNDTIEHERIIVSNDGGQLVLIINEGARSTRPNDERQVTETTRQSLGEISDILAVNITAGEPDSEFDELFVTIGTGENVRNAGPFNVRKLNTPGIAAKVRPMLILPPGRNYGEGTMAFERPADMDLTGRPLYDLDSRLKDKLIDPSTGKQWMTLLDQPQPAIGGLEMLYYNLDSWGRPARDAEVTRGLLNQVNDIIMDPPVERNAEAAFNLILPSPLEQAEAIADETGHVPEAVFHPIADIGDGSLLGPNCPAHGECLITPDMYDQKALDALFKEQAEKAVDIMHAAFVKGEKPTLRIDFISQEDANQNPFFWSKQYAGAGSKDEFVFRGRFEKLVQSAIDVSRQIAATKYIDMPMDDKDIKTIVMVPNQDTTSMMNQGDYYNVTALARYLESHPNVDVLALPFLNTTQESLEILVRCNILNPIFYNLHNE